MKTKPFALIAALLAAGMPLPAQQATGPTPQPEQRTAEQNRRGGPTRAGMPPQPRGEMNSPQPGGWGPQNQPPKPDPFMENFFPPELIMHNQQLLNLGEEQTKRLIGTIQKAQPQFTEWQWQLEAEQTTLLSLVRTERPDEKQVSAQLEKVLRLEGEMRRGQLMLLVRLKNELTAEQQTKLRSLMHRPGPGR